MSSSNSDSDTYESIFSASGSFNLPCSQALIAYIYHIIRGNFMAGSSNVCNLNYIF